MRRCHKYYGWAWSLPIPPPRTRRDDDCGKRMLNLGHDSFGVLSLMQMPSVCVCVCVSSVACLYANLLFCSWGSFCALSSFYFRCNAASFISCIKLTSIKRVARVCLPPRPLLHLSRHNSLANANMCCDLSTVRLAIYPAISFPFPLSARFSFICSPPHGKTKLPRASSNCKSI